MQRLLLCIPALLLALGPAGAQTTWKSDKTHGSVRYTVNYLIVSEVEGRFTDFDATLVSTKDDFSDMQVEAVIRAASISTDNEKRDGHLRSDDFLNAEKYPELRFKSTRVERTGDNTYALTGDLTIRNITRPVVLGTKVLGVTKDRQGNIRAGFRAAATIDRFQWGVNWSAEVETGGLVVSRNVTITLLLSMVKS